MPWDHCEVEFILDDEPCPRCGVTKGHWTVQVGETRELRLARRRPAAPAAGEPRAEGRPAPRGEPSTAHGRTRVHVLDHTGLPVRVRAAVRTVRAPALPDDDAVVQHAEAIEPEARAHVLTLRRRAGVPSGSEHEVSLVIEAMVPPRPGALAPPPPLVVRLRLVGTWDSSLLALALGDGAWQEGEAPSCQVAWRVPLPDGADLRVDALLYAFRHDVTEPHDVHVVLCAPRAERAAPADPWRLDVLAYNLFMRPTTLMRDGQRERARLLPALLGGHDVLVLSELFDDDVREPLLAALEVEYPHQTPVVGEDGVVTQDGGVVIASRWPFTPPGPRAIVFRATRGSDGLAEKGAVHVRLVKGGVPYHVIGTHMQSSDAPEDEAVRREQLAQLQRELVAGLPADEAVLVAGDLNIHRDAESGELARALHALGAVAPRYVGSLQATFDPGRNDLATADMGGTEYLDHVLWVHRPLRPPRPGASGPWLPRRFEQAVLPLRARWDLRVGESEDGERRAIRPRWDLSDHFAVHAELELEP